MQDFHSNGNVSEPAGDGMVGGDDGTESGSSEFPGKSVIIPLYSLIFLLSVVGNLLVILTLARNRRMVTVTNVFLLNLAISDLLLGVFCMPATLIGQLLQNFVFGEIMCRIIPYFQAVSVSVGVWTLVAISIERYFAICRPLHSRKWQTKSHAYKIILLVWIVTPVWNVPITLVSTLQPIGESGRFKCRESWPSLGTEKVFNVILVCLLLVLPLCIMAFSYSLIVTKLWKGLRTDIRSRAFRFQHGPGSGFPSENSLEMSQSHSALSIKAPGSNRSNEIIMLKGGKGMVVRWKRKETEAEVGNGDRGNGFGDGIEKNSTQSKLHSRTRLKNGGGATNSKSTRQGLNLSRAIRSSYTEKSIESKRKVIRMLFVLVLEFFICWTPLYVMHLWYLFSPEVVYKFIGPLGVTLIQLLAYSSSCSNPITYCFMNRRFRFAFLKLFQFLHRKRKSELPTVDRRSEVSGNDSLLFPVAPRGSVLNKSEVLVLEGEEQL